MSSTVILNTILLQDTTGIYSFEMVDQNGAAIDVSQLETITLTYYDKETRQIINTREAKNILQANNVIITTVAGPPIVTTLRWEIQQEDTIIIDARRELETHIALFEWTWATTRKGVHEVQFQIESILYVS